MIQRERERERERERDRSDTATHIGAHRRQSRLWALALGGLKGLFEVVRVLLVIM
jgi:hypothetical protein